MLGADHRAARLSLRSPGRGLEILTLAVLSLGVSGPSPMAAEWLVGGSVSQGVEVDTNRDLEPDEGQPIYGATTAFGLDFTALAPRTQWQFETGAAFSAFGGPGDTDGLNGAFPNAAAAVAHDGKYIDTGASFALDLQPVAFAQLDDTGVTAGDATQLSALLAADAAYALDPRNSLVVGGFGRIIRFIEGTTSLDPTTIYGANLTWARDLTAATQGNVTFGARRFTADSLEDPDSLTFDLGAGIGHAVNRRLSFAASLGPTVTRTTRTRAGERGTDVSVGAAGGLDVGWQPQPDTQLAFALSHGLEPTSLGELQTTTAIGVGVQHAVNSWTSAGFDVLLQRQSTGGGFEDDTEEPSRIYAAISPSIAFSLTPDWALQAGYTLRVQREDGEDGEDALSNLVFMTITRQFDILR